MNLECFCALRHKTQTCACTHTPTHAHTPLLDLFIYSGVSRINYALVKLLMMFAACIRAFLAFVQMQETNQNALFALLINGPLHCLLFIQMLQGQWHFSEWHSPSNAPRGAMPAGRAGDGASGPGYVSVPRF